MDLDDLPQPAFEGTVSPDGLDTDGENPNEQSDETFGLLCDRMRDRGWLGGPIIADADKLVADGEHRLRAAREIGLDEVPVKCFDFSDADRRMVRQELNKIEGEHDRKRDALEYSALLDAGKADEVDALVNAADEDLDELLAEIRVDKSQGPLYEYDTDHNVYFEDCVEGMAERLDDDSVDCVITDPPYGFSFGGTDGGDRVAKFDGVEGAGDAELVDAALKEISRVLKPSGHIYLFWSFKDLGEAQEAFSRHFKHLNTLVWDKGNIGISGGRITGDNTGPARYAPQYELVIYGVQDLDNAKALKDTSPSDLLSYDRPANPGHPTEKPVPLITHMLNQSTSPGDTILDPFMGSGTTAVAAIQSDRSYVGFEIDAENYRPVIERRIGEAKRQMQSSENQPSDEAEADD